MAKELPLPEYSVRRIRITMSYDGTEYHGWQLQPGLPTIQGAIQDVLSEMEGSPVHVHGSGRTVRLGSAKTVAIS